MRILMVHNDYGRPSGEEEAVDSLAQMLAEHGHEVHWLRKSSEHILNSKFEQARAFFTGIHSFRSRREIAALVDRVRPDLVQVQNVFPRISPAIFKPLRTRRLPVVMRCPNYRLFCPSGLHLSQGQLCEKCLGGKEYWCALKNCENNRVKSIGYALRSGIARRSRSILDGVNLFVVLTEFQRQRFLASGIPSDKLAVLPNSFPQPAADAASPLGETVAFIGRPAAEKGIEQFLAAARSLPEIPFAIAGDPICTPGIEKRLPANVKIHGFLRGAEFDDFLRVARILVVPSLCFDSFPNVLLRAMMAEKPVVASRLGPLPEIIQEEKTGLLYEPHEVGELATAIKKLYYDRDLCQRLGRSGRQLALDQYSRENCYQRLMEIYERARRTQADHGDPDGIQRASTAAASQDVGFSE